MRRTAATIAAVLTLAAGLAPSGAWAYCSEPSMWDSAPSAPYCLSDYKYSGSHSCGEWEIDRYIADINSYIRELSSYAEEARSFGNSAISFANSAIEYAECEANDARSGLE